MTDNDDKVVEVKDFITITADETDSVVEFTTDNVEAAHKALDCYVTYKPMIEASNIKKAFTKSLPFDFFQESFSPPLKSLVEGLEQQ